MAVGDSVSGASFHAIPAEDTTRIVDIVDAGITAAGRNTGCAGILCGFDINAMRRACGRTQKAANAFLQAVFITLEDMNSPITRLKMHRLVRIVLRGGLDRG